MGVPVASPVGGQGAVKGAALMWTKEYFFLRLLVCLSSPARCLPQRAPSLAPGHQGAVLSTESMGVEVSASTLSRFTPPAQGPLWLSSSHRGKSLKTCSSAWHLCKTPRRF